MPISYLSKTQIDRQFQLIDLIINVSKIQFLLLPVETDTIENLMDPKVSSKGIIYDSDSSIIFVIDPIQLLDHW